MRLACARKPPRDAPTRWHWSTPISSSKRPKESTQSLEAVLASDTIDRGGMSALPHTSISTPTAPEHSKSRVTAPGWSQMQCRCTAFGYRASRWPHQDDVVIPRCQEHCLSATVNTGERGVVSGGGGLLMVGLCSGTQTGNEDCAQQQNEGHQGALGGRQGWDQQVVIRSPLRRNRFSKDPGTQGPLG
jgi:hypothetical protein